MEEWTSGTGQKLSVHNRKDCVGDVCCIHKPTNHHMLGWPQHWRDDRGIMERLCPCGVGHPDPDDSRIRDGSDRGVHGCCGCCIDDKKPKGPPGRILMEGDTATKCPFCGSSRAKAKWYSRKSKYCINPDCVNYIIRVLVRSRFAKFKAVMRKYFWNFYPK